MNDSALKNRSYSWSSTISSSDDFHCLFGVKMEKEDGVLSLNLWEYKTQNIWDSQEKKLG